MLCVKFQHLHLQCMHIVLHVTGLTLDVTTSAHGMYYLDFGHSVVSTSHSVSATGVQRDHNYDPPEKYVQDSIHV